MSQEGREAERPGSPWWPQAFFSRPLGTGGREATSSPFQSLISSRLFLWEVGTSLEEEDLLSSVLPSVSNTCPLAASALGLTGCQSNQSNRRTS